jgi:hypothetical protein
MIRLPLPAVVLAAIVLLFPSQSIAQQFGAFDPERIFAFGDTDLDGRLSLDEYRELCRASPRMKNAGAPIEPLFRRLDLDRDGFLSAAEYRKSFSQRPRGSAARPGGSGEKPASSAPPVFEHSSERAITPDQEQFFESQIRPVLVAQCGKCHSRSAEKLRGGLRLDSRASLLAGGDSGRAIVPGNPDESLLIQAIRYSDKELRMPPTAKLPDAVVADFESWVTMGAPDPRTGPAPGAPRVAAQSTEGIVSWSFRPPKRSAPPRVKRADWPRSELDCFVLAALEARGLSPVADAERSKLVRRVTFDLTGLPPTPGEIDEFLADESADAFGTVVDRLLGSPRFGERWGRHWLDVARFAESSGKTNFTYPQAWRYRDWVIASFNADKPYDQFVREQIAGDLLPAIDDRSRAEKLIATGFLALGSKAHDAENHGQFVLDLVDEQIEATSRAFLALTVACARCHDHKVDPITQRDYYALSGVFRSTRTCSGTLPGVFPNFNSSPLVELPANAHVPRAGAALGPKQRAAMEERLASLIRERDSIPPGEASRDRFRRTNSLLAMVRYRLAIDQPGGEVRAFAMGVLERDLAVDSPIYTRGELDQPGEIVPRGLVGVLGAAASAPIKSGSGRRELALWLASPANPLAARVMVNRVWQHLLRRGLVPTPDNFGAAGQPPSHPELLDNLAVGFMADGWSIKRLIRRIVLSRAYQLDSAHDAHNFEIDPDNALVWRMGPRRLEAEEIRDSMLFVSGRLSPEPPIGSPVAKIGEGLALFIRTAGMDAFDTHRSIYLPVIRDRVLEPLALFDFADPSIVTGERSTTTSPAQALYFRNAPFVIRQAEALAERLETMETGQTQQIDRGYRLALARLPTPAEREQAIAFLREFAAPITAQASPHAALSAFCQALFAAAEFRYLD